MPFRSWTALLATSTCVAGAIASCERHSGDWDNVVKQDEAEKAGKSESAGSVGARRQFDPRDPAASGMALTFDDEFGDARRQFSHDGARDGSLWNYQTAATVSLATVHDGVLDISTDGHAELKTVTTDRQGADGWVQKYGYFEVRMRVGPTGAGSGFFLMSQAHSRRGVEPASELDVIETDNKTPTNILTTLHRDSAHPGDQQNAATGGNPFVSVGVDVTQDFHTYGALWDPDSRRITWYFDCKEVMTQPKYDTTDRAPMWMDIMTGYAGTRSGGHVLVDYVRAWQFPDRHPVAVEPQPVSHPFGKTAQNASRLPGSASKTGGSTEGAAERPGRERAGTSR